MKGAAFRLAVLVSRNQLLALVFGKHHCFLIITYFGTIACSTWRTIFLLPFRFNLGGLILLRLSARSDLDV